jgi:hypothetical protein
MTRTWAHAHAVRLFLFALLSMVAFPILLRGSSGRPFRGADCGSPGLKGDLTISVYGGGRVTGGTATSKLNCAMGGAEKDCVLVTTEKQMVTLTAVDEDVWTFVGWSNADPQRPCPGNGSENRTLTFELGSKVSCQATFSDTSLRFPDITVVDPNSGAVGARIDIGGHFDGATIDNLLAKFGGVQADVEDFTIDRGGLSHIITHVPMGAGTGKVSVTTPGGTAMSPSDFTVTTPGPSCANQLAPNQATISPPTVAAAPGSTTSHAVTLSVNVMNPTTAPMTVQSAVVAYPGGAAHCTLSPGPATVMNPTEIAPGATGVVTITQSVNITIAPNFTGSCGWLVNLDLTTTCGQMQTSISGSFKATF